MGRAEAGSDDDPTEVWKMRTLVGGVRVTQSAISERKVLGLNGRLTRSKSLFTPDGGAKEGEEGNNNNNCNGGAQSTSRRRSSASFQLRADRWMQDGGAPAGDFSGAPAGDFSAAECAVYCVHADFERYDAPDLLQEEEEDVGSSPEPELHTLEDLAAVGGDFDRRDAEESGGGEARCCRVCLEEKSCAPLPCCRKVVCDVCLSLYVTSQVRLAKPYIKCPIPECSGFLEEGVVTSHLAEEDVVKYHYFLELSQLDSKTKPCPQCSHFTSLEKHNPNHSELKYKIQCANCQFVWCFKCHAPWHLGLKCRDYRKGDKLLRTWASVIEHGQRNAQKCPRCKIHIQRTEGCDHMTCTQCNTNFCYRCGERYQHLRFFGDHTSNLSVFGCKYRYLPEKPHLRRFVRGSICATKLLIAPLLALLFVVFGAVALVIGLVVFPVYYVCKRKKKQRAQGSGRWI